MTFYSKFPTPPSFKYELLQPACPKDDVGRTPGQAALLYCETQVVEIILAASRSQQILAADKVRQTKYLSFPNSVRHQIIYLIHFL